MMDDISLVIAPSHRQYRTYCEDKGLDRKTHRFIQGDPTRMDLPSRPGLDQLRGHSVPAERVHFTEGYTVDEIINMGAREGARRGLREWSWALQLITGAFRA